MDIVPLHQHQKHTQSTILSYKNINILFHFYISDYCVLTFVFYVKIWVLELHLHSALSYLLEVGGNKMD